MAARCAAQVHAADLAAVVVAVQNGRTFGAGCPAVPPGRHDQQEIAQFAALVGEDVFVPRGPLAVELPLQDVLLDQPLEAFGEDLARDPQFGLQLVEPGDADEDVTKDRQRVPLGNEIGRNVRPIVKKEATR